MKDAKLLDFGSIQEAQDEGAYQLIFQNAKLKTFLLAPEATMLLGKDAMQQNLPSNTRALAQPFLGHAFHQLLESAINAQKWHYVKIVLKNIHLLEVDYRHLAFSPLYSFYWSQIQQILSTSEANNNDILQSDTDRFSNSALIEILCEVPDDGRIMIQIQSGSAKGSANLPNTGRELRKSYTEALYQLAQKLFQNRAKIESTWTIVQAVKNLSEKDDPNYDMIGLYNAVKRRFENRQDSLDGPKWNISFAKIAPVLGVVFSIALFFINKDEESNKVKSNLERIGKQQKQIREKENQEMEKYAAFTNNFFEDLFSQTKQFAQNDIKKEKAQRPETGEYVYTDDFYPDQHAMRLEAFEFTNDSNKDLVLFIRNDQSKFVCAARYVRSHESLKTVSLEMGAYELLIANGKNWTDNLSDDESDPLPGFTKENDFFGIYDKSKKSINGYKMEVDRQHLEVRKLIFDGTEIGVNWKEKQ
jgi:hypothetical protein